MLTPAEIQAAEFAKGMRGYKEEEVDLFLDEVTVDFEKLVKENMRLNEEIAKLSAEIREYEESEGTILKTLEAAKLLMSDISVSAEKRAEILLKNAELDADIKVREAKERAERIVEETAGVRERYEEFTSKFKKLLEDELARFDTLSQSIFPEFPEFETLLGEKPETYSFDHSKTIVKL